MLAGGSRLKETLRYLGSRLVTMVLIVIGAMLLLFTLSSIVPGDPAYQVTEDRIALLPQINVPTIVLDGRHDAVDPPRPRVKHEAHFSKLVDYRNLDAGHNTPQENPREFARAVSSMRDVL